MTYIFYMKTEGRPTKRQRTSLGERIVQARKRCGISQKDLAEELGVSQQAIVFWERSTNTIRSDTLAKLAQALNVTSDELLGLKPPRQGNPSGRANKIFDAVKKLPRRQQEKVFDFVEPFVENHMAKAE